MQSVTSPEKSYDYRTLLSEEFLRRLDHNPAYSVRAFAKSMKISPSYASLLLRGQRKLSLKRGSEIAAKMNWSKAKVRLFRLMVQFEECEDPETRETLTTEIEQIFRENQEYAPINIETFRVIATWYHTAIVELTRVKDFKPEPSWIGQRLNISRLEAELALERLTRLKVLKRTKSGYERTEDGFAINNIKSAYIRNYHKQVLHLASQANDTQGPEGRNFSAVTIATNKQKVKEVDERIKKFRRELVAFLNEGKRDCVYQLSIQLFRLDET